MLSMLFAAAMARYGSERLDRIQDMLGDIDEYMYPKARGVTTVCGQEVPDGSYLDFEIKTCMAVNNCMEGQVTCTDGASSTCGQCADGYFAELTEWGSDCTECTAVMNCDGDVTCNSATDSECSDCADGFYGDTCTPCEAVTNCMGDVTCQDASSSVCSQCATGYQGDKCDQCVDGYFSDGGACTQCVLPPSCAPSATLTCTSAAASDTTCSACVSNQFYGGSCDACPAVANCEGDVTCQDAQSSVCSQCASGFYLDAGACTACVAPPGCASGATLTCTSAAPEHTTCSQCDSGYYFFAAGSCTQCNTPQNCAAGATVTCSSATDSECDACESGFEGDSCETALDPCDGLTGHQGVCPANPEFDVPGGCSVHAKTVGKNCKQWCNARGRTCLRGQDNKNNCNLDPNHSRQEQGENGCLQEWNDQVCVCSGAWTVDPQCHATFCEHYFSGGKCCTKTAGSMTIHDFWRNGCPGNDKLSTIIVRGAPDCSVQVWQHGGENGRSWKLFGPGTYEARNGYFSNDQVSSARIGCKVGGDVTTSDCPTGGARAVYDEYDFGTEDYSMGYPKEQRGFDDDEMDQEGKLDKIERLLMELGRF